MQFVSSIPKYITYSQQLTTPRVNFHEFSFGEKLYHFVLCTWPKRDCCS